MQDKKRLTEKHWKHIIPASQLHKAIDDCDINLVRDTALDIIDRIKKYIDDDNELYALESIEEEFAIIESTDEDVEDQVDFILDELYDFCDLNNIFLDPQSSLSEDLAEPGLTDTLSVEVDKSLVDLGISGMFTSAISAEWQRLDEYNSIVATLISENADPEIIQLVRNVIDNITLSIGQLEVALQKVSNIEIPEK